MSLTATESKLTFPNIKPSSSRILIVEDDQDVASFTRHVIQKNSGSVTCDVVLDSFEAIQKLYEHRYGMILLDQNLPGMSGTEFLKKMDEHLDQDPVLSDAPQFEEKIPVIMMSGAELGEVNNLKLQHFEITQVIPKKHLFSNLQKIAL